MNSIAVFWLAVTVMLGSSVSASIVVSASVAWAQPVKPSSNKAMGRRGVCNGDIGTGIQTKIIKKSILIHMIIIFILKI